MNDPYHIRFINRHEIDVTAWDACIRDAPHGVIYARSFYLDQMAPRWDALVLDDYRAVMPLTWNWKFGIRYCFQPFLTSQLGVFGKEVDEQMTSAFLNEAKERFPFIEINLNAGNDFELPVFDTVRRVNYTLSLRPVYQDLAAGFRSNHARNIKKALAANCVFKKGIPLDEVIALASVQLRRFTRLKEDDLDRFRSLCNRLMSEGRAITAGVYTGTDLLASCILFYDEKRVYYILAGNHPDARDTGASHLLIARLVEEHAGTNRIFDFEGSDNPSIALYYEGFGASVEYYRSVRLNRLPFFISWIKG